jgi:hypothetical protein
MARKSGFVQGAGLQFRPAILRLPQPEGLKARLARTHFEHCSVVQKPQEARVPLSTAWYCSPAEFTRSSRRASPLVGMSIFDNDPPR